MFFSSKQTPCAAIVFKPSGGQTGGGRQRGQEIDLGGACDMRRA